jgi:hypothetical protein
VDVEFAPDELKIIKEHRLGDEWIYFWNEKVTGGYVERGANIETLVKHGTSCYVEFDNETEAVIFEGELRTKYLPNVKTIIDNHRGRTPGEVTKTVLEY